MEDKMNKDFDRSMEQMMNQHSVAPPFGAWNRISAELATTAPAATPIAPRIPKSAWIGFLSGASLIATLVGGTFIYNNYSNQPTLSVPTDNLPTENFVVNTTAKVNTVTAERPMVKVVQIAAKTSNLNRQDKSPIFVLEIEQKPEAVLAENQTTELINNIAERTEQTYFFPAVDINTGKEQDESIVQYAMPSGYNSVATHQNETEKKVKSNTVKEIRFKPRRDKKRPHNYGRFNHLK